MDDTFSDAGGVLRRCIEWTESERVREEMKKREWYLFGHSLAGFAARSRQRGSGGLALW